MRYFHKLIEGVLVMPVIHALRRQPELWRDGIIVLRNGDASAVSDQAPLHLLPPKAKAMALDLMGVLGGVALGAMSLNKLDPGQRNTMPAQTNNTWFTPYYLMLESLPGALVTCGDETVNMLTGEVWWSDPREESAIINNSKDERIAMRIDIRID